MKEKKQRNYSKRCEEYAEEHEQLAEWLEELKANKVTSAEVYEQGYKRGYNKAIDDFAKWLVEHKIVDEDSMPEIIIDFNEEQLKEGGDNND